MKIKAKIKCLAISVVITTICVLLSACGTRKVAKTTHSVLNVIEQKDSAFTKIGKKERDIDNSLFTNYTKTTIEESKDSLGRDIRTTTIECFEQEQSDIITEKTEEAQELSTHQSKALGNEIETSEKKEVKRSTPLWVYFALLLLALLAALFVRWRFKR